jgi:18S rRNA (guanine1575-N7)-methyltransferase
MEGVDVEDARRQIKAHAPNMSKGSKAWIVKKKEQMERKGKIVKATSKYTGRKRRIQF